MQSSLPYISAKSASGLDLSKVVHLCSLQRYSSSYTGNSIEVKRVSDSVVSTFSSFGDTLKNQVLAFLGSSAGKIQKIYCQKGNGHIYTSGENFLVLDSNSNLCIRTSTSGSANMWQYSARMYATDYSIILKSSDDKGRLFSRFSTEYHGYYNTSNATSSNNLDTPTTYVNGTAIGNSQTALKTSCMNNSINLLNIRGGKSVNMRALMGYFTAESFEGDFYEYIASTEHIQDVQDAQLEMYGI